MSPLEAWRPCPALDATLQGKGKGNWKLPIPLEVADTAALAHSAALALARSRICRAHTTALAPAHAHAGLHAEVLCSEQLQCNVLLAESAAADGVRAVVPLEFEFVQHRRWTRELHLAQEVKGRRMLRGLIINLLGEATERLGVGSLEKKATQHKCKTQRNTNNITSKHTTPYKHYKQTMQPHNT